MDDENIGRLADLLGELASRTQFLMVTHNKHSAARASNLYGITMEEPGISKVVSLRLPTPTDPAAEHAGDGARAGALTPLEV